MKVKSESEVAQLCPTLSDPVDCSLPGSSIHGIFQARVLEWGAIAFSENLLGTWKALLTQWASWPFTYSFTQQRITAAYQVPGIVLGNTA